MELAPQSTRVITPGLTGVETIGNASVAGCLIGAGVGITATSGSLAVTNSRIATDVGGIISGVSAELRDTLVHVKGGGESEFGVISNGAMSASQVTIAGTGDPEGGALLTGRTGDRRRSASPTRP